MLDFNFLVDDNELIFQLLRSKNVKLDNTHSLALKKIKGEIPLDIRKYLEDNNILSLLYEFMKTKEFETIFNEHPNTNKYLLAVELLTTTNYNTPFLKDIKNSLWEKMNEEYKKLQTLKKSIDFSAKAYLLDEDIVRLFEAIKNTDYFKKIKNETLEYCNLIKSCWQNNKDFINEYLRKTLNIPFDARIDALIFHPDFHVGHAWNNTIYWGHTTGTKDYNYNIVYLTHEALHIILPPVLNDINGADINHSIIELISDNELYSRLSGKDEYHNGHEHLKPVKERILPYWEEYLKKIKKEIGTDNIKSFENYLLNEVHPQIKKGL